MFNDFVQWTLAVVIAICIIAGLMAVKLLLMLLSYVIAVFLVAVLVVAGIKEYKANKKKPP